jgi:hypothetical protein
MNPNEDHQPTKRQLAYLRYLISRAHAAGVPYLPIDYLHAPAVHAWIEFLEPVAAARVELDELLAAMSERKQPAPYRVRSRAHDRYVHDRR